MICSLFLAMSTIGQGPAIAFHAGPGNNQDGTTCTHVAANGTRYFGGMQFTDSETKFDFFIQAVSPTGEMLWRKVYGPQRGGDRIPGFSERFWRNDIPSAITSDDQGNVYIAGSSTFGPKYDQFGQVVVSYDSKGVQRFATKIQDWSAGTTPIAVSKSGTIWIVGVAGVKESRRLRRNDRYPVHLVSIDQHGKVVSTLNLGTDRPPADIRAMPDGTVVVLLRFVGNPPPIDDIDQYTWANYKPGAPATASYWIRLVLSPRGKIQAKQLLDDRPERLRGNGVILASGGILTVDGYPDGVDRLTSWSAAGAKVWSVSLGNSIVPGGQDRFHQRLYTPLSSNNLTAFAAGYPKMPASWYPKGGGPQFRWGVEVESFDLASGAKGASLLFDTNSHMLAIGPEGMYADRVLSASSEVVLLGGSSRSVGQGQDDAWMLTWHLR
jgi:hypothetical protein